MLAKNLVKEAFEEVIKELGGEIPQNDLILGDTAAQLAQAKGELNTILDRAAREGVLKKSGGKVKILNKEEYIKRIGGLPGKIKNLQKQLEPPTNNGDNIE